GVGDVVASGIDGCPNDLILGDGLEPDVVPRELDSIRVLESGGSHEARDARNEAFPAGSNHSGLRGVTDGTTEETHDTVVRRIAHKPPVLDSPQVHSGRGVAVATSHARHEATPGLVLEAPLEPVILSILVGEAER